MITIEYEKRPVHLIQTSKQRENLESLVQYSLVKEGSLTHFYGRRRHRTEYRKKKNS
jgi:hypothetical protein